MRTPNRLYFVCIILRIWYVLTTVYPKKYAHGFCFAVLCCGYTLTDFPISIRLTSLALWQSNDCPSASKATLMNVDKYFMWIHYERLRNHNKAKHNKTVCIFLGIYCINDCAPYGWWIDTRSYFLARVNHPFPSGMLCQLKWNGSIWQWCPWWLLGLDTSHTKTAVIYSCNTHHCME